jgi:hypothetical protein
VIQPQEAWTWRLGLDHDHHVIHAPPKARRNPSQGARCQGIEFTRTHMHPELQGVTRVARPSDSPRSQM